MESSTTSNQAEKMTHAGPAGNDGFDQPGEDRSTLPEGWIDPLVKLIQSTTGLDGNDSRTAVYFAIATHALPNLRKFPILAIYGPTGTGKTTLLLIIEQLSREAVKIDGKATKAVLRDSLRVETTALIEEADDTHEEWMVNRYSKDSDAIEVNRPKQGGWSRDTINVFGATALHRRTPFRDPAILSRSITVNSRHKAGGVSAFRPADFNQYSAELKELAQRVNWELGGEENTDRIADTWLSLLALDAFLGGDWGQFAEQQMERARADLRLGHEEEPSQAVYRSFLALALQNEVLGPEERVLLADIARTVQDGLQLNSWQVGKLLRDLGFKTDTAGGHRYAYTGGSVKLVEAGLMLGVQDQWIE
jgi:energy-coupling factor transporter ATP-binding protein EcfA2